MRLENKVAIVTGGGRGIGRGIARMFAQEGAKVVLAARTQDQLDNVLAEIEADGGTAAAIATDMTVTSDIQRMVEYAVEHFGKLDVLVNNAGIGWWGYKIDDDIEEAYDRLMGTNLKGVWMAAHFAVPHMKEAGAGSIIGISSVHAWATFATGSVYAASKGGMVAGTRGLALELAPFMIRVNTISPGAIQINEPGTFVVRRYGEKIAAEFMERFRDVLEERRRGQQALPIIGQPEDIAYCAVYLASDESRFVTGVDVTVDGGMTAQLGQGTEITPELRAKEKEMYEWIEQQKQAQE